MENRRLRGDLQLLKGGCSEGGSASAPHNSNRMRGDGLTLHNRRVRLGIKRNRNSGEVLAQLPREWGVTTPGGVQSCREVALRDVGSGMGWGLCRSLPT